MTKPENLQSERKQLDKDDYFLSLTLELNATEESIARAKQALSTFVARREEIIGQRQTINQLISDGMRITYYEGPNGLSFEAKPKDRAGFIQPPENTL